MRYHAEPLNKELSVCLYVCLKETAELVRDIEAAQVSAINQISAAIQDGGSPETIWPQIFHITEQTSLSIGSLQFRLHDLYQQHDALEHLQELIESFNDSRSDAA